MKPFGHTNVWYSTVLLPKHQVFLRVSISYLPVFFLFYFSKIMNYLLFLYSLYVYGFFCRFYGHKILKFFEPNNGLDILEKLTGVELSLSQRGEEKLGQIRCWWRNGVGQKWWSTSTTIQHIKKRSELY